MANMQLLSRLGAAPLAIKYLVTPATRLNWPSVSRSTNKFHSSPRQHDVSSYVKEVESFRRLEMTDVFRSHKINASLCQNDRKKFTLQVDGQVSSTYKWKPKHAQKGALFGNRGHDILTYINSNQEPLTQQLMPVRHYCIPEIITPPYQRVMALGDTYSCYFSDKNVEKIRTLARSEYRIFSSIFLYKKYTVDELENLPIRKFSEDKIFGLPLDLLIKKDIQFKKKLPQLKLPALLHLLLQFIYKNGLTTKGIFKSPEGSTKVKDLKADIEANFHKTQNYEIDSKYNVHDVAAALKDFIADLQKPLMTTPEFHSFPDFFLKNLNLGELTDGLNYYFLTMTPEHRDSLQMLITVLSELTKNSAENGLTPEDCAAIFAPVLFSVPPGLSEEEATKKKKEFFDLIRVFLVYEHNLFLIPVHVISKLRRSVKTGVEPSPSFFKELKITIKPQDPKEEAKKMKCDDTTTAEEIVEFATGEKIPHQSYMDKLKCEILGKDSKTTYFIHETGGLIGEKEERVLHPNAKPLPIWRENTAAVYTIKSWNGYSKRMSQKAIATFDVVFRQRARKDYGADATKKTLLSYSEEKVYFDYD